ISPGTHCDDSHLAEAEELMASVGRVVRVPEKQQDAVTAISGSGPAYVFFVVESMIEAGVHLGLPRSVARRRTAWGRGTLLCASTRRAPAVLAQQAPQPPGTTGGGGARQAEVDAGLDHRLHDERRRRPDGSH
ncbi:pyrroline-5-carboxylate reductase family protein, partial [Pimelobacter simplex]|uniref:pyrroline-5-carboxylate reductase family protein n=1 Tax=Nocardioides simplex TaxID=2045 RepID=UPI00265CFC90